MPKSSTEARRERLAAALKANLKRRKQGSCPQKAKSAPVRSEDTGEAPKTGAPRER